MGAMLRWLVVSLVFGESSVCLGGSASARHRRFQDEGKAVISCRIQRFTALFQLTTPISEIRHNLVFHCHVICWSDSLQHVAQEIHHIPQRVQCLDMLRALHLKCHCFIKPSQSIDWHPNTSTKEGYLMVSNKGGKIGVRVQ
ncbi:hypothetical protein Nepgr_011530 [Nepenthes gracilis]|uniref:Secreted protein n=1 Tax=Nepenthes gracilis TaxID=150966 RepID=A0AAD3XME2_NEPGR|nr:hypothetical protein Nepgr_011530 [Nepenthes gracilis]